MEAGKRDLMAKLALLFVAIAWGSSLVVVKTSTDAVSPNLLLALRFSIGCIVLSVIFHKKLIFLNKTYLSHGAIIGFCLFLAYCSQTVGVIFAMPGKSAFLSSSYCVVVPFLAWLIEKRKPDNYNVIAAILCIIGICLATFTESISLSIGDGLALLSAVLFAAHIVSVARLGKGLDPVLITILQFGFAAIFAWILSFTIERPISITATPSAIGGILYLAVICTALSLLLQNIGQKYTSSSSASLILSLESVFGVIFGVLFAAEEINAQLMIGFVFIFAAILISELKPEFLSGKRRVSKSVCI
ncbi:MAG: DMT family transporter [Eubacteriales bacterium]|nr:DMT family transporter [Eubacteriales bacterium]